MNKAEYLIFALAQQCHHKKSWMISAFSITSEGPDDYKRNPYVGRLVRDMSGISYLDDQGMLVKITDASKTEPLYQFREPVIVTKSHYAHIPKDTPSVIGNLLFNLICILNVFGNKLPFYTGKVSLGKIESDVAKRLTDTPSKDTIRDPNLIYVDEYIKFVNATNYLKGWSQLSIQGPTYKTLTPPPGIKEFKAQLLKEHAGHLDDPATLAVIDKALIEFDAAYLKGDPGGELYADSKKSRNIVRKKLFLMLGAEQGLMNTGKVQPSFNSLEEGWEVHNLPALNDSLRAGSFNRGSQTQLGGLLTKQILRATTNLTISTVDCGTTLGIPRDVTADTAKMMVGSSIVVAGKTIHISNVDVANQYIGQVVIKRSPMYCKAKGTDFCSTCIGDLVSSNKQGLSLALSDYGSRILLMFLSKMHGSSLTLVPLDRDNFLS